MRKIMTLAIRILLLAGLVLPGISLAAPGHHYPDKINLPNGFNPEGITRGEGNTIYVASIPTGAIYKADVRTGQGSILVPGQEGRLSLGLSYDPRTHYLYVAGHVTGQAYVYNADTGATVAIITLTTDPGALVNDVAITEDAVYFTDTFRAVFYKVPLGRGGRLPRNPAAREIALSGDFVFNPGGLNGNGIVAVEDGKYLIIDHTDLGRLYRVNANTGRATQIDLGVERIGQDGSDGLVLVGHTLYVVDYYNYVVEVQLNGHFTAGRVKGNITSPSFDRPTTAAQIGNRLYVVASRSDTEATPTTEYWVSAVSR